MGGKIKIAKGKAKASAKKKTVKDPKVSKDKGAAKRRPAGPRRRDLPVHEEPSGGLFGFVARMMTQDKSVVADNPEPLILATGCSGLGTPSLVLHAIIGSQVLSSVMKESAAFFLIKNVYPCHVFEA